MALHACRGFTWSREKGQSAMPSSHPRFITAICIGIVIVTGVWLLIRR